VSLVDELEDKLDDEVDSDDDETEYGWGKDPEDGDHEWY
jgi:hypothetical protein